MFDHLIRGGLLIDGSGGRPEKGDVALQGGVIAAVGDLAGAEAAQTTDATGRWVCPGFIDAHSHSDAYLLIEPSAPSKLFQGITTEIVGNCGASAAPRAGACRMPSDWQAFTYPGTWHTVADYRRLLAQVRPAPNVGLLIGHNTLRASVMGYDDRPAGPEERMQMERLLAEALDQGGLGLSTGLIYSPGCYSTPDEVTQLARVAARRDRIFTSHMRSEGARLLESMDECIGIGRETGVRVQISHLKTSGPENWHKLDAALERLARARGEGVRVAADRYPYTASCTDLDVLLPAWAAAGSRAEILARLRDPGTRRRIREDILRVRTGAYWSRVHVGSTVHPGQKRFQGLPLEDVARALGLEPVEAVLELIERDELGTGAIFFGMSEENMRRILASPHVMVGSDASLRAPAGPLSHDHPHPRAYGTFPRYLRMVLDGEVALSAAEAVRRVTALPAEQFGLKGRGRLAAGWAADVVVLDPSRLADRATYAAPHQLSEGVEQVWVNGILTLAGGALTGGRGGVFLG